MRSLELFQGGFKLLYVDWLVNVAPREALFGIKSWCDTKSGNGVDLEENVYLLFETNDTQ